MTCETGKLIARLTLTVTAIERDGELAVDTVIDTETLDCPQRAAYVQALLRDGLAALAAHQKERDALQEDPTPTDEQSGD